MVNIWKGILYTGLAGAIGVGGYLLGKYRHMGGKVSLTMVGLALVLYAPKGCDVMDTYVKTRGEIEKAKIYGTARHDSIDAVIRYEKSKESKLNLIQPLQEIVKQPLNDINNSNKQIEATYNKLISENEKNYQQLLKKNDAQYNKMLTDISEQNTLLKKDLETIKRNVAEDYTLKEFNSDKASLEQKNSKQTTLQQISLAKTSIASLQDGTLVSVKTEGNKRIEDRVLSDGSHIILEYIDNRRH